MATSQPSPSSSSSSSSKDVFCPQHDNKIAVQVCIDCAEPLCAVCIRLSQHSGHQVLGVKEAVPVLQKKLNDQQRRSNERQLAALEQAKAELDKTEAGITSIASQLYNAVNTWEAKQLALLHQRAAEEEEDSNKHQNK